ncbi:hypothetical protein MKX01_037157 [Papaver californicum]|nr:hypothetical protein MKX01_037157 [Papaver californicum]
MEDQREKNGQWLSVPQFGDWEQKGGMPDYSMDFSKIREMRKQNKRDPSRLVLVMKMNSSTLLINSTTKNKLIDTNLFITLQLKGGVVS